mmetsp:Transcript_61642/g.176788  ORF Transcript_61642/g.176788 Transcript_61642/m.176788 type:complete len:244 (-) Transcript_61642:237-968(-)
MHHEVTLPLRYGNGHREDADHHREDGRQLLEQHLVRIPLQSLALGHKDVPLRILLDLLDQKALVVGHPEGGFALAALRIDVPAPEQGSREVEVVAADVVPQDVVLRRLVDLDLPEPLLGDHDGVLWRRARQRRSHASSLPVLLPLVLRAQAALADNRGRQPPPLQRVQLRVHLREVRARAGRRHRRRAAGHGGPQHRWVRARARRAAHRRAAHQSRACGVHLRVQVADDAAVAPLRAHHTLDR